MAPASFHAGTIAARRRLLTRTPARRGRAARADDAHGVHTCARRGRVRAPSAHLLGLPRIGDQLAVRGDAPPRRSPRRAARSPARTSARCRRAGSRRSPRPDEASSNGRAVDDPGTVACGRRVMLRLTRAAEIARANALNGTSPSRRDAPVSPWKSSPPSAMSRSGREARRLADHRLHPVTAKLVAVAVEEDVDLLLDVLGREELGIGAPVQRLAPARTELEQPSDPSLRVREHEVVLPRIRTVIRVEAGVHSTELGKAHRNVAVVEDDRDAEALAQRVGDAPQMRHRDREDDHRVRPLGLDEPLEMPLPTRRHPARDRLARELVERRLLGIRLGPPQIAIALHAREHVSDGLVRLALAVGRVRSDTPPRRLDRPAAIRRDHEVDAGLVHPLPELPPRGRTAVPEVEVDRGCDREDLRRLHRAISLGIGTECSGRAVALSSSHATVGARRATWRGSESSARDGHSRCGAREHIVGIEGRPAGAELHPYLLGSDTSADSRRPRCHAVRIRRRALGEARQVARRGRPLCRRRARRGRARDPQLRGVPTAAGDSGPSRRGGERGRLLRRRRVEGRL